MGPKAYVGSHLPPLDGKAVKYCLYLMLTSLALAIVAYPQCPEDCYKAAWRGKSEKTRAFSSLTSLHRKCYTEAGAFVCQSQDAGSRKFWAAEMIKTDGLCENKGLTEEKKTCFTCLPQSGMSDGGGVQGKALQKVIKIPGASWDSPKGDPSNTLPGPKPLGP